jgi:hypothetical protein
MVAESFSQSFEDSYELADNILAEDHGHPSKAVELLEVIRREIQPVNDELADDICELVLEILPNYSFSDEELSSETLYIYTGASDYWVKSRWSEMLNSLITYARFLNPDALDVLKMIFDDVVHDVTKTGESLIVKAGPGHKIKSLHRARTFQHDEALKMALSDPEKELGPPPTDKALAGRMNAKGISVFYGANLADAAIAEVRPPVGSKVLVAEFELLRELRLLDLTRFNEIDPIAQRSIFDTSTLTKAQRQKFISKLEAELVKPVMPDHSDDGYLVTQVIADYLSMHPELDLDGVIYRSIQFSSKGVQPLNIALFNKASYVQPSFKLKGDEVHVLLWDWDIVDVDVFLPEVTRNRKPAIDDDFEYPDDTVYTLELIPNSLTVHEVQEVKVQALPTKVKVNLD